MFKIMSKKILCETIGHHQIYDYNDGPNFVFTLPIHRLHASQGNENVVYFVGKITIFVIFFSFFFIGPFAFLFGFCPFDYYYFDKKKTKVKSSANDIIVEN